MEKPNTPREATLRGGAKMRSEKLLSTEVSPIAVAKPTSEVSQVLSLLARDHALVLLCDEDERVAWVQDRLALLPQDAHTYLGQPIREVLPAYGSAERYHEPIEVVSTEGKLLKLDIRSFAVHASTQSRAVVARRISDLRSEALQSPDGAALLVSLLDSAPEPALACDRGGFVTFANAAAAAFLGQEASMLVGRPLLGCVPARPELTRLLHGLLPHDVVDVETEVPGSQGRSWIAISSRRLRGCRGEVNGNVLFIRDTSDQHRARNELAAKNAEFDDYVSHVSHDLRSPLVSVLGFAGLLRLVGPDVVAAAVDDDGAGREGVHQAFAVVDAVGELRAPEAVANGFEGRHVLGQCGPETNARAADEEDGVAKRAALAGRLFEGGDVAFPDPRIVAGCLGDLLAQPIGGIDPDHHPDGEQEPQPFENTLHPLPFSPSRVLARAKTGSWRCAPLGIASQSSVTNSIRRGLPSTLRLM